MVELCASQNKLLSRISSGRFKFFTQGSQEFKTSVCATFTTFSQFSNVEFLQTRPEIETPVCLPFNSILNDTAWYVSSFGITFGKKKSSACILMIYRRRKKSAPSKMLDGHQRIN